MGVVCGGGLQPWPLALLHSPPPPPSPTSQTDLRPTFPHIFAESSLSLSLFAFAIVTVICQVFSTPTLADQHKNNRTQTLQRMFTV